MIQFKDVAYIKNNKDKNEYLLVIKEEYRSQLLDIDNIKSIYVIYYLNEKSSQTIKTRPNPIGLSLVNVIAIDDNYLTISPINVPDNTVVLDIIPYEKVNNEGKKNSLNKCSNNVIELYTDGSCYNNPGPGGYAAIIVCGKKEQEVFGFVPETTNNRMELIAVIEGLHKIKKGSKVKVYSDSNYVIKGITHWIKSWKNNNWKTASNRPVKNVDLWQQLDSLTENYKLEFIKVKGHSGHEYNDKVDLLAKEQIELNQ